MGINSPEGPTSITNELQSVNKDFLNLTKLAVEEIKKIYSNYSDDKFMNQLKIIDKFVDNHKNYIVGYDYTGLVMGIADKKDKDKKPIIKIISSRILSPEKNSKRDTYEYWVENKFFFKLASNKDKSAAIILRDSLGEIEFSGNEDRLRIIKAGFDFARK